MYIQNCAVCFVSQGSIDPFFCQNEFDEVITINGDRYQVIYSIQYTREVVMTHSQEPLPSMQSRIKPTHVHDWYIIKQNKKTYVT